MDGQDVVTPMKRSRTKSNPFYSPSSRSKKGFTVRTRKLRRRRVTRRGKSVKTKAKSMNAVAALSSHPTYKLAAKKGVTMNMQFASSVNSHIGENKDSFTVGLIHNTCPTYYVRLTLWAAIARKIFDYWGFKINDWSEIPSTSATPAQPAQQPAPGGIPAPGNVADSLTDDALPNPAGIEYYSLTLYWRQGDTEGASMNRIEIAYNGESYMSFAYKMMNWWHYRIVKFLNFTGASAETGYPNLNLHYIRARRSLPSSVNSGNTEQFKDFDMIDCYFHFSSNSLLKFQNRSVTISADQTTDDIDLLPLVGKSYTGNGNGVVVRENQADTALKAFPSLLCSATTGVRKFSPEATLGATVPGTMSFGIKPPPKTSFKRVTSSGASSLAPGEIDNSLLTYSGTKKLNVWLKLLNNSFRPDYPISGTTVNRWCPTEAQNVVGNVTGRAVTIVPNDFPCHDSGVGKFRMFMWEKQINSIAPSVANSITVHFEHDIKLAGFLTFKNVKYTMPYQFKAII